MNRRTDQRPNVHPRPDGAGVGAGGGNVRSLAGPSIADGNVTASTVAGHPGGG